MPPFSKRDETLPAQVNAPLSDVESHSFRLPTRSRNLDLGWIMAIVFGVALVIMIILVVTHVI